MGDERIGIAARSVEAGAETAVAFEVLAVTFDC
jgi:hypothetical protein